MDPDLVFKSHPESLRWQTQSDISQEGDSRNQAWCVTG